MGKGDQRTKRGKIIGGTFGKYRKRKKKKSGEKKTDGSFDPSQFNPPIINSVTACRRR